MHNERWLWQGELWSDNWEREFMFRRDLSFRNRGTVEAAKNNFLKNRVLVPCHHDFLDACYGDHGRSTHKVSRLY